MVLLDEVKRMLTQTQVDIQMNTDFSFLPTKG
ncbi:MAG: hypothetical protein EORIYHIE_000823 [Candidatus Fervidibacter sp.]|jgi:hypothetical protein